MSNGGTPDPSITLEITIGVPHSQWLDHTPMELIRGDSYTIEVRLIHEDGDAADLTDAHLEFCVKARTEDDDCFIFKSLSDGIVVEDDDPTTGHVYIIIYASETVPEGQYVYDISGGPVGDPETIITVAKGIFTINRDVY